MHAILASLGTDGDVLPFIGLGAALLTRGHRVTLVAAESYAETAANHGLAFRPLLTAEKMRVLLGNADFWHPLKAAGFTAKWGNSLIEPQYRLLESMVDSETVLVSNPAIFAAMLVHEKFQRPLATILLQPWLIPSSISPPIMPIVGLPTWAPRVFHQLFYRALDLMGDCLVGPTLNKLRRSLGLKPKRRIFTNWLSPQLVLGMFPDWFGPPPPDWPPQVRLTGFPLFDGAIKRTLPPAVLEFVTRKKPTVIFTFGSGMMHADQLYDAAARVCSALGAQGLFINRYFTPPSPAPNMLHVPFLPFSEIFPHCAAIVHHGGIGTTAECMAAAVPQLILPLGYDQLDNGARVQKLGAGLHTPSKHDFVAHKGPIRPREIDEITDAIRRLLSPEFRACAAEIGKRLQTNRALETAAIQLESLSKPKS